MSPTSASVTSSKKARPVAVPLRPSCSSTRSDAAVATKVVSTRVQSRVPPTAAEWLVNGKEAIATRRGARRWGSGPAGRRRRLASSPTRTGGRACPTRRSTGSERTVSEAGASAPQLDRRPRRRARPPRGARPTRPAPGRRGTSPRAGRRRRASRSPRSGRRPACRRAAARASEAAREQRRQRRAPCEAGAAGASGHSTVSFRGTPAGRVPRNPQSRRIPRRPARPKLLGMTRANLTLLP